MKEKLRYDVVEREALAVHLERQTVLSATAEGTLHLYHCQDARGESLAIALENGQGVIVRLERPLALDRRRAAR